MFEHSAKKDEVRVVSGTLDRYRKRGWCRVETVAAFCPKRFEGSGEWRPPPLGLRYRFHHDPEDAGVGELVTADDLLDPRDGEFNNESDRAAIEPLLKTIALEYLAYDESGATTWDTLINVRERPAWLKELGEEGEDGGVRRQQGQRARQSHESKGVLYARQARRGGSSRSPVKKRVSL